MKKPEYACKTNILYKICKSKMVNMKSHDDLRSKLSELKDQKLISIRDSDINLILTHVDILYCCKLARIDCGQEYV